MSETIINYNLPDGDRTFIRNHLITTFLKENPGTGRKNLSSRYQYNVENFENYSIYLRRPTQLNKGFDFTVNVGGMYFKKNRRYSNPSHNDIFKALNYCKNNYPDIYPKINKTILDIYYCNVFHIEKSGAYFKDYDNNSHPIEIILLALKWLFIEQDCAYWNYSGRATLFNALKENDLVY